jgi:hypothetical protein
MNSNRRDIITDFVQNNANIRKILNLDNTFLEYPFTD